MQLSILSRNVASVSASRSRSALYGHPFNPSAVAKAGSVFCPRTRNAITAFLRRPSSRSSKRFSITKCRQPACSSTGRAPPKISNGHPAWMNRATTARSLDTLMKTERAGVIEMLPDGHTEVDRIGGMADDVYIACFHRHPNWKRTHDSRVERCKQFQDAEVVDSLLVGQRLRHAVAAPIGALQDHLQ